jgi:hypothetical protein
VPLASSVDSISPADRTTTRLPANIPSAFIDTSYATLIVFRTPFARIYQMQLNG